MKKLFGVTIIIALFGCASSIKIIDPIEIVNGVDFTPYTKLGFFITPEKYGSAYESIGIIDVSYSPQAEYKPIITKSKEKYLIPSKKDEEYINIDHQWVINPMSFNDVLSKVYKVCIDMGADALVNFHSEIITNSYKDIENPITITGYRITGYAIKRKEK
jgi:hypothetical protein